VFFFQAEDGIRDFHVTGVQTCALPIWVRITRVDEADTPYPAEDREPDFLIEQDERVATERIAEEIVAAERILAIAADTRRAAGVELLGDRQVLTVDASTDAEAHRRGQHCGLLFRSERTEVAALREELDEAESRS